MGVRAEPSFALKDQLFNAGTVAQLAARIEAAHPPFARKAFEAAVLAAYPQLELKARIAHTVDVLEAYLPADFAAAMQILRDSLPARLDPSLSDDDFGQFIWAVPGEWMARHGVSADRLEQALDFLMEATQRFTSEGALRPFLRAFPEHTLAAVHAWTEHDNYHVRRLASEGIRPYLPWAVRAPLAADTIIAVLDKLHRDPTRFVVRSVANTLNDISKDDPDLVVKTLRRWRGRRVDAELDWLSRHALRTLLKQDHPGALALLGYTAEPDFELHQVEITPRLHIGEKLSIQAALLSASEQRLKVTVKVHFLKANGKHSAKVFALRDGVLQAGETLSLRKEVAFRPMTTRTLYPGAHYVEILVNGVGHERVRFELLV
ncbi:MAG: DNA alkylation repair protein [Pseudomonadota bacterium]